MARAGSYGYGPGSIVLATSLPVTVFRRWPRPEYRFLMMAWRSTAMFSACRTRRSLRGADSRALSRMPWVSELSSEYRRKLGSDSTLGASGKGRFSITSTSPRCSAARRVAASGMTCHTMRWEGGFGPQ